MPGRAKTAFQGQSLPVFWAIYTTAPETSARFHVQNPMQRPNLPPLPTSCNKFSTSLYFPLDIYILSASTSHRSFVLHCLSHRLILQRFHSSTSPSLARAPPRIRITELPTIQGLFDHVHISRGHCHRAGCLLRSCSHWRSLVVLTPWLRQELWLGTSRNILSSSTYWRHFRDHCCQPSDQTSHHRCHSLHFHWSFALDFDESRVDAKSVRI
jgi:hypothetical protein